MFYLRRSHGNILSFLPVRSLLALTLFAGWVVNSIAATSTKTARAADVRAWGAACDGKQDDGPAFQAAVNATPSGNAIRFPGNCYIDTTVRIDKSLAIEVSNQQTGLYVPRVTAFVVTAPDVAFRHFKVFGNRSSSSQNMLVRDDGQPRLAIDDVDGEKLNTFATISGGFFHRAQNIHLRNMVRAGFILDQFAGIRGVEILFSGFEYDTDGQFAEPTVATIWARDFDGVVLTNFGIIHGGQIADFYINPRVSRSGDHWIGPGYFDIAAGDGVQINPEGRAKADRIFFTGTWFATQTVGLHITGPNQTEGINVSNSLFYNERNEGILDDNAWRGKFTHAFRNNLFASNNLSAHGHSDLDFSPASPGGFAQIVGNTFNNSMGYSSPAHNIFVGRAGQASIEGNDTTYSNASGSKIAGLNGTTVVNPQGWTKIASTTIRSATTTIRLSPADMASYTGLYLVYSNLAHDRPADVRIALYSGGGTKVATIEGERTQFRTSSQFRQTYLDGGRKDSRPYRGSLTIQSPAPADKQVLYNSNTYSSTGQGLISLGTVETDSAIDAIELAMAAGKMTGGTVTLFGRP